MIGHTTVVRTAVAPSEPIGANPQNPASSKHLAWQARKPRPRQSRLVPALRWLATAIIVAHAGTAGAQAATTFPDRAVRIIVPQPTGSVADRLARRLVARLADAWKQDVTVENRPGTARLLPAELTARPTNDGHVLLLVTAELFELRPNAAAAGSIVRTIQPVMLLARAPLVLTADRGSPIGSVESLRSAAAARPGALVLRTGLEGSLERLVARHLTRVLPVAIDPRPRRDLPGIVEPAVDLELAPLPALLPSINAGTARTLVLLGAQRVPILRELPTAAERSLSALAIEQWFGIAAAVALPAARLVKLHQDFALALASQDVHDGLIDAGFVPVGSSPAEFAVVLQREEARLQELVRSAPVP